MLAAATAARRAALRRSGHSPERPPPPQYLGVTAGGLLADEGQPALCVPKVRSRPGRAGGRWRSFHFSVVVVWQPTWTHPPAAAGRPEGKKGEWGVVGRWLLLVHARSKGGRAAPCRGQAGGGAGGGGLPACRGVHPHASLGRLALVRLLLDVRVVCVCVPLTPRNHDSMSQHGVPTKYQPMHPHECVSAF